MSAEICESLILYIQIMTIVKEMLRLGIIDRDDYSKMEEYLANRYKVDEYCVFRLNNKL